MIYELAAMKSGYIKNGNSQQGYSAYLHLAGTSQCGTENKGMTEMSRQGETPNYECIHFPWYQQI